MDVVKCVCGGNPTFTISKSCACGTWRNTLECPCCGRDVCINTICDYYSPTNELISKWNFHIEESKKMIIISTPTSGNEFYKKWINQNILSNDLYINNLILERYYETK